jgi:malate dehydrogenase (oxaloacetate-decarboxylating)
VGAAGVATARMLRDVGVADLVGCDRNGAVHPGRDDLNPSKLAFASWTNPHGLAGTANELLASADVFLGLSGPGAVTADAVRTMADDAIAFALANPTPEVLPSEIEADVAVIATGRSDYPNQINNVLAFPGVFRGALDVRATAITEEMKLAAAYAIAGRISESDLSRDYIVPSVFDRSVAPAVAEAVARAAGSA